MELNEKDLHCIARLLQGAVFGGKGNPFDGCEFCKYKCHLLDETASPHQKRYKELSPHYGIIMRKLTEITDVDLLPKQNKLFQSGFPYKKFLKNSNEEIKDYFRNYFNKT